MRVLAIDTALEACAAAILDSDRDDIVASESQPMPRGHAEELLPLIARVMDRSGLDFVDLDRIAVTVGPGSFTGLRVGISAARGIALAGGIPIVGLSTLAAFAAPHIMAGQQASVASVIDAKHGNVYFQVFAAGGRTVLSPRLVTLDEAVRVAMAGSALLVGSGAELVAALWPEGGPPGSVDASAAPDIAWVARMGVAADERTAPPKPLYLRQPDARPQDAARLPRR